MAHLQLDPNAATLLTPVLQLLQEAADGMAGSFTLQVGLGHVDGFSAFEGDVWLLSEGLAGPEMHHPSEIEGLELDRWRRAMASVLEGIAWQHLIHELSVPRDRDGWWCGAAVALADEAAPSLGLAASAHVQTLVTGDLAGRGASILFADVDVMERAAQWAKEPPTPETLLGALAYALRPEGPRARLPLAVALPDPVSPPYTVDGWHFERLRTDRPGLLSISGVAGPSVIGSTPALVVACEQAEITLVDPTILGGWDLASCAIPSTILGARGVTMRFYRNGALQILFADAFVGPLAAIEIARTMGHSGMTSGSWTLTGADSMAFGAIRDVPITMHQRDGSQAIPQVGFGVTEWIAALAHTAWTVRLEGDDLHMSGRLMDMPVRLRLRPEAG